MTGKTLSTDYTGFRKLAVDCVSFKAAGPALERLAAFPENLWPALLEYTDRRGLTLQLLANLEQAGLMAGLPGARRAALDGRRERNRIRLARRMEETACLLQIFHSAGLRAAVLKGFTLEPDFVSAAHLRSQYDLDFYLPAEDAARAHVLLRERGYETLPPADDGPASHLPTLIRKTGWEWRGDIYDPEIPAGIELHCRLWNPEFERIPVEVEADPLGRLEVRRFAGREYLAFCRSDLLACLAMHAMKHLFRGSLRLSHLYELAYFLEQRAKDKSFWESWRASRPASLRRLTTAALELASRVFRARLPEAFASELALLPRSVMLWIPRFSSTLLWQERSGKCEVLLQLALIESWPDRAAVLRRRLLPLQLPAPMDAVLLPEASLTWRRRLLRQARQGRFVCKRAFYHLRSFPKFALASTLWLWDLATASQ